MIAYADGAFPYEEQDSLEFVAMIPGQNIEIVNATQDLLIDARRACDQSV
jgi:hypothetical protein